MTEKKDFYAVEVVQGGGMYLVELEHDGNEMMVHTTTKNILSPDILTFDSLETATYIADSIRNDAFADNPRPVLVSAEVELKEAN